MLFWRRYDVVFTSIRRCFDAMCLLCYALIPLMNAHTDASNIARGLSCGLSLLLHRFNVCTNIEPVRLAQSVTCLTTDARLTADPGVARLIPVRFRNFVEIDHEIISMVILIPSADSFQKDCGQIQAQVCTNYWLTGCSSLPRKKCG